MDYDLPFKAENRYTFIMFHFFIVDYNLFSFGINSLFNTRVPLLHSGLQPNISYINYIISKWFHFFIVDYNLVGIFFITS